MCHLYWLVSDIHFACIIFIQNIVMRIPLYCYVQYSDRRKGLGRGGGGGGVRGRCAGEGELMNHYGNY
jgi:hypothetical protein